MGLILAAVSGGIDSMCMADILYGRGDAFGIAHCNFCLRGEESDSDEALVRGWARDRGIPFHVERFDTEGYASEKGISIEMAARELRYGFFARVAREHGYSGVAVAHNADDNAETLILNLLRGTGIKGLTGMKREGTLPVPGCDIPLLRPLLSMTRAGIMEYAASHGVPYHEDRTNLEVEYKRNKVRNLVFPVFFQINPSFVSTLCDDMHRLEAVSDIADEWYGACRGRVFNGETIDAESLMALPHWEYVLWRLFDELGMEPVQAAEAARLLKSGPVPGGRVFASRSARLVSFRRGFQLAPLCIRENDGCTVVEGPGIYNVSGTRFSVEQLPYSPGMKLAQEEGTVIVDAAAIPFPFIARGWKAGDWMKPLGLGGSKKLSDLFVDLKFSPAEKASAVVLLRPLMNKEGAATEHVAALLGYRIDEAFRVGSGTKVLYRISISNGRWA